MKPRLLLKSWLFELLLIFIITIPSFISLLNNNYFSMHDDQHVARLYLLDQGLRQGDFYPRWVDGLGFGFGYPLFNFYPPLIYYIGEFFHLIGFSLIWSIKLTFILGFILAAWGIYLFAKRVMGKTAGFLSATLYTYFFYHAVLIYVRGALAEFFSLGILPFVFIAFDKLSDQIKLKNSLFFGIAFALLILTHPLVAFPTLFYLGFFFIFYLVKQQHKLRFLGYLAIGFFIGLSLSIFFWLPSMTERQYTLVDNILTKELADYKLHYVYLQQFFYSLWGYGGSIAGPFDGMTFQLGKIHIILTIISVLSAIFYLVAKRKFDKRLQYFFFFAGLLIFSLFMTTVFSSFIWDNIKYLWYLQFPWRFMTFAGFFISLLAGYSIAFQPRGLNKIFTIGLTGFLIITTIVIYQKYFTPQRLLRINDSQLTTQDEISWRVSRSSFEFVPKGITTKKTGLNTTTLAIKKKNIPDKPYAIINGQAQISVLENKFSDKQFLVNAQTPIVFRLNTYNFPGWKAYINNQPQIISSNNKYKLITVNLPAGQKQLKFVFEGTQMQKTAYLISIMTIICIFLTFLIYRTSSKK